MQWQSHVNYYGASSCNETLSTSGFTVLTAYFAGCGNPHPTKKYQRIVFIGLVLSDGESIAFRDGSQSGPVIAQISGPFNGTWDTGCIFVSSGQVCYEYVAASGCSDDSDCGPCEKCVDGECVPCEKCVDGKGVVTLWGVRPDTGDILTDGLSVDLSSGVASVQLSNFDTSMLTAGRIQIFNGMSGTLTVKAGIGILGSDFGATVTLFSGAVSGHYQDFLFDSGNLPFGYSFNGKIVFEILNYDTLGDCADDDVDDTPDDGPIDVVDGGEPQPPGGSGPGTVTPPGGTNTIIKVIVIKPSPPDNGCECEKYLADALYYNFDSFGNRIIDLTNSFDARLSEQNSLIHSLFSDHNRILFEQFSESNRLSYELSLFLAKKFYPQLLKIVSSVESLSADVSSIKDSLRLSPCEPDYPDGKTIAQIADDFEKHYYPATVEVLENDVVLDTGSDDPDIFCRKLRS